MRRRDAVVTTVMRRMARRTLCAEAVWKAALPRLPADECACWAVEANPVERAASDVMCALSRKEEWAPFLHSVRPGSACRQTTGFVSCR